MFLPFLLAIFLHVLRADVTCPKNYEYNDVLEICLYFPGIQGKFDDALSFCRQSGGDLPSIHNAFQNAYISSLYQTLFPNGQGWIGANDQGNGNWTWSDGKKWDYDRLYHTNHFGPVAYMDASEQVWRKDARNVTYSFLCASSVTGLTEPTSTQSPITVNPTNYPEPLNCLPSFDQPLYKCQNGWKYSNQTGFEYLVLFDKTFADAEEYCQNDNGHLASIHSDAENDFIAALCCPSNHQVDHDGHYYAFYLTGAHFYADGLSWNDGTPADYQGRSCNRRDWRNSAALVILANDLGCSVGGWDAETILYFDSPYAVCKRRPQNL